MKKIIYLFYIFSIAYSSSINAQVDVRSFTFGHSLLDHRPPLIPTPSDETTVAHWMHLLAVEAGHTYESTGQYGYLPSHATLPPSSNWGYDIVTNYVQWQAPTESYYEMPGVTPINTSQNIINWLSQEEPGIKIYIYENWPDMAPYVSSGSFPPSTSDMIDYHAYTNGDFHNWWLEYHDSLLLSNPVEQVRMIPAGPILSDLHMNTVVSQIPITELYEDNAPHGRATTYFLASLVTYMATYEELAPLNYTVPSIIHPIVQNNYTTIVNHIWNELLDFNLPNGDSRVFFNNVLPVTLTAFEGSITKNETVLEWSTAQEYNTQLFEIEHSIDGLHFNSIGIVNANGNSDSPSKYDFTHRSYQPTNYYRLKIIDRNGAFEFSETILIIQANTDVQALNIYPNPSHTHSIVIQ